MIKMPGLKRAGSDLSQIDSELMEIIKIDRPALDLWDDDAVIFWFNKFNMEAEDSFAKADDSMRQSQNSEFDKTRDAGGQEPGFGEDFSTTFGTDLDFIDHTAVGQIVPLKLNEHLATYKVDKSSKASSGNMVYEVSGMR